MDSTGCREFHVGVQQHEDHLAFDDQPLWKETNICMLGKVKILYGCTILQSLGLHVVLDQLCYNRELLITDYLCNNLPDTDFMLKSKCQLTE